MIQEANLTWRHEDTSCGLVMPWYTKPALEWLLTQDIKDWAIFEYGCGYSTVWYRAHAPNIVSVDHNEKWAASMGAVHIDDKDTYISFIAIVVEDDQKFDLVIVDGEWRLECVAFSREHLKPGGYLIYDNYNQEGFEAVNEIDALLEGWERQVFKQVNHTSWHTAVFRKPL